MQIVSIPKMDRDRVAAMVTGRKSNLLAALPGDAPGVVELAQIFFEHLAPIAAQRFGESVALFLGVSTIRRHKPGDAEHAPRHTDARFFPPNGEGLTFWCPLDHVGETAPGVTFFTAEGEVTPRIGPGTAIVVPPTLPHQTQALDGDRLSVEFRCTPAGRLPENVGESRIAIVAASGSARGLLIGPAPQFVRDGLCAMAGTGVAAARAAAQPD